MGRLGEPLPSRFSSGRGAVAVRMDDRLVVRVSGGGHARRQGLDHARLDVQAIEPGVLARRPGAIRSGSADVGERGLIGRFVNAPGHQWNVDERLRRQGGRVQRPDLPVMRGDERPRAAGEEGRVVIGRQVRRERFQAGREIGGAIDRSRGQPGRPIDRDRSGDAAADLGPGGRGDPPDRAERGERRDQQPFLHLVAASRVRIARPADGALQGLAQGSGRPAELVARAAGVVPGIPPPELQHAERGFGRFATDAAPESQRRQDTGKSIQERIENSRPGGATPATAATSLSN